MLTVWVNMCYSGIDNVFNIIENIVRSIVFATSKRKKKY